MPDHKPTGATAKACVAEAKRVMDEILRENPSRVRYDILASDERPALSTFAGIAAADYFRECLKRPAAR